MWYLHLSPELRREAEYFLDLARHRQIELALAEPILAEVARILDKKFPG